MNTTPLGDCTPQAFALEVLEARAERERQASHLLDRRSGPEPDGEATQRVMVVHNERGYHYYETDTWGNYRHATRRQVLARLTVAAVREAVSR